MSDNGKPYTIATAQADLGNLDHLLGFLVDALAEGAALPASKAEQTASAINRAHALAVVALDISRAMVDAMAAIDRPTGPEAMSNPISSPTARHGLTWWASSWPKPKARLTPGFKSSEG